MDLCYFDRTIDTDLILIVFVLEPKYSEKEVIKRIGNGDYKVKYSEKEILEKISAGEFNIGKTHYNWGVINIITQQCQDLSLGDVRIIQDPNYKTVITVMKEYIYFK